MGQLAWRLCTGYTMLEFLVLYCLCGHGVMGSLEQEGLMAEDTSAFRQIVFNGTFSLANLALALLTIGALTAPFFLPPEPELCAGADWLRVQLWEQGHQEQCQGWGGP